MYYSQNLRTVIVTRWHKTPLGWKCVFLFISNSVCTIYICKLISSATSVRRKQYYLSSNFCAFWLLINRRTPYSNKTGRFLNLICEYWNRQTSERAFSTSSLAERPLASLHAPITTVCCSPNVARISSIWICSDRRAVSRKKISSCSSRSQSQFSSFNRFRRFQLGKRSYKFMENSSSANQFAERVRRAIRRHFPDQARFAISQARLMTLLAQIIDVTDASMTLCD